MKPELFTYKNIHTLQFPQTEDGDYARRYLLPIMQDPQRYFSNIHNTELMIAKVDDVIIPITVTDFHLENSYTVSPYNHYIAYGGYEEIKLIGNPFVEALIGSLLGPLSWFFRRAEFDRVAYVNNYMLSTNLYPSVNSDQLSALCEALPKWFPDRAIVFRSVDGLKNPRLMEVLKEQGYDLALSRQIWFMEPQEFIRTRQYKEDVRALRSHAYEVVNGQDLSDEELARALHLYNLLYLEKYSHYNPQFTLEFMKLARDEHILHLRALKRDGRINAVMGFFIRNGAMTQPLFGYDTSMPQEEGLYRLLTLVTLREGLERNLLVHASSGVGKFKKVRGGKSVIEYNAVFTDHLPVKRRLPWKLIRFLTKFAAPYFQKMDF